MPQPLRLQVSPKFQNFFLFFFIAISFLFQFPPFLAHQPGIKIRSVWSMRAVHQLSDPPVESKRRLFISNGANESFFFLWRETGNPCQTCRKRSLNLLACANTPVLTTHFHALEMPAAPIGWFLPEDVPGRKDSEGSTGSRSLSQRRRMRQSHYTLREEVCKPVQHPEKEVLDESVCLPPSYGYQHAENVPSLFYGYPWLSHRWRSETSRDESISMYLSVRAALRPEWKSAFQVGDLAREDDLIGEARIHWYWSTWSSGLA